MRNASKISKKSFLREKSTVPDYKTLAFACVKRITYEVIFKTMKLLGFKNCFFDFFLKEINARSIYIFINNVINCFHKKNFLRF